MTFKSTISGSGCITLENGFLTLTDEDGDRLVLDPAVDDEMTCICAVGSKMTIDNNTVCVFLNVEQVQAMIERLQEFVAVAAKQLDVETKKDLAV